MAPRRLLNAGVCLFIAAPLSLCLVPGDIAHCLELSSTATSRSVEESVLRLVDPQAWINAIGTRLENWDMMLAHRSSALVVLTGRDWQPAMDRMVALAHPHNIFIWFYLMGGILSVCLFTFMMGHLLRYLALSARTAAGPDHFLHGTLLALNILALLILLLNAWANAMPAVFGILVGLSHRVIVLHATGHQKVIGATSSSLEMR